VSASNSDSSDSSDSSTRSDTDKLLCVKFMIPNDGEHEFATIEMLEQMFGEALYTRLNFVPVYDMLTMRITVGEKRRLALYVLITPFCGLPLCGSLLSSVDKMYRVILEIADVFCKLHEKDFYYVDIKTHNFCMDDEGRLFILDYGSIVRSKHAYGLSTYPHPTHPYGTDVVGHEAPVVYGLGVMLAVLYSDMASMPNFTTTDLDMGFRFKDQPKAEKDDQQMDDDDEESKQKREKEKAAHEAACREQLQSHGQSVVDACTDARLKPLLRDSILSPVPLSGFVQLLGEAARRQHDRGSPSVPSSDDNCSA
jgi:hypothetical protein